MKVSINWLKELVELNVSLEELVRLLPFRTIGIKEVTSNFIELDMKGYNRADLLSLRGVSYEVAAILDSSVKFREFDAESVYKKTLRLKNVHELSVKVENINLAPLYCLVKIEGLRAQKSPLEWQNKLLASGMRPVNNIADITNLVMLEYGQPLHAFDAQKVEGETIIVRTARKGEKITTLDGKDRTLESNDLLITDPKKAVGIAGVMGGKNSEVSAETNAILLEAAIFDPANLRRTATRLGLQSEASKRFYHGLTKTRLFQALDKAVRMYQEIGGKVTGIAIVGDFEKPIKKIKLTQQKINSLVGVKISPKNVEDYLRKLHFTVIPLKKRIQRSSIKVEHDMTSEWEVSPPYFRLDVEIEEDVIEEVARMYGYEKIPSKALEENIPKKIDQSLFDLIHNLKTGLVKLGLTEVQTYPYYSTNVLNALGFYDGDNLKHLIKIANPISAETEYLRKNIWPNLVETVAKNERQGYKDIGIFEVGKYYFINDGKVNEKYSLSVALMNGSGNPLNELTELFKRLTKNMQLSMEIKVAKKPDSFELFHPNRFQQLYSYGKMLGELAEIHKRVSNKMGSSQRVAVLEIGLNKLLKN